MYCSAHYTVQNPEILNLLIRATVSRCWYEMLAADTLLYWLQLSLHISMFGLDVPRQLVHDSNSVWWNEIVIHYLEDCRLGERTNKSTPKYTMNQKWVEG